MSMPRPERYVIMYDLVSAMLIFLAIFVFGFGLTWQDPLSVLGAVFIALGLGGTVFFNTVKEDPFLDKGERFKILLWFSIDVSVIIMINFMVQEQLPLNIPFFNLVPMQALGQLGNFAGFVLGIGEEVLFGILGTAFLWRMTRGNLVLTLLLICGFFMVYHFAVYGSDLKALLIVAGGRFVLSFSIIETRHITSATTAHGLINLISG